MSIEITIGQFSRSVTDFRKYSKSNNIKVEFDNGVFFVYGTELECLRILAKYHMVKKADVCYSDNRNSFYFRLEISGFTGNLSTED